MSQLAACHARARRANAAVGPNTHMNGRSSEENREEEPLACLGAGTRQRQRRRRRPRRKMPPVQLVEERAGAGVPRLERHSTAKVEEQVHRFGVDDLCFPREIRPDVG